ncbi:MAG: hypothetical protein HKN00_06960 [Flavobacteriaceae bacterium]|nr:hypothetical protein [Flavobacteriaceae bacterium]NNK72700.1 hypothetical protein [Flavobacteriaceae bacterium]
MTMRILGLIFVLICFSCSSSDDNNSNNNNNNNNNTPRTTIPDEAFEQALIDLGFDNALDGSVATSSIENVTDLVMNNKGITSLQGLEDFSSLLNLWVNDNSLTSINVAQNGSLKFLYAERNMLTQINVTNLANLEKLGLNGNQLTAINVANNFNLQQLVVPDNQIENIDVSNNTALTVLNVVNNPLTCIRVNAEQFTNTPAQWQKDAEDQYALTCN